MTYDDRKPAGTAWFVTIKGVRHNLGPERKAAFDRFHVLMVQPQKRSVQAESVVVVIDCFLEFVEKHRARETYIWYQSRLQLFGKPALFPARSTRSHRSFVPA